MLWACFVYDMRQGDGVVANSSIGDCGERLKIKKTNSYRPPGQRRRHKPPERQAGNGHQRYRSRRPPAPQGSLGQGPLSLETMAGYAGPPRSQITQERDGALSLAGQ